jgi:ribosomal protein S27AE
MSNQNETPKNEKLTKEGDELINEIKSILKDILIERRQRPVIITTHLNDCPECGAPQMLLAHIESCLRCMSCGFTLCK